MIFKIDGHTGDLMLAMPALDAARQKGVEVGVYMNPRYYSPVESLLGLRLVTNPAEKGEWLHLTGNSPHITDRWVKTTRRRLAGIKATRPRLTPDGDFVLLQPWCEDKYKMLPIGLWRHIVRLCEQAGHMVFVGGPEVYRDEAEYITAGSSATNYCGMDTGQWVDTIKEAHTVITVDSGAGHVADYMGKRTLVLFRTTNPETWAPAWQRDSYLKNPSIADIEGALEELFNG